jgi:hypothetical protein
LVKAVHFKNKMLTFGTSFWMVYRWITIGSGLFLKAGLVLNRRIYIMFSGYLKESPLSGPSLVQSAEQNELKFRAELLWIAGNSQARVCGTGWPALPALTSSRASGENNVVSCYPLWENFPRF